MQKKTKQMNLYLHFKRLGQFCFLLGIFEESIETPSNKRRSVRGEKSKKYF